MINFMLPGLYEKFSLNKSLIEMFNDCPQYFINNCHFGACYGSFQHCIWDGGRTFLNYRQATYEEIVYIRDYLKKYGIPLRLIYTNPVISEEHLGNRFCNLVTSLCEDISNDIVVNSEILENFLRESYPKYNFISSTTKCKNNLKEAEMELNKDYKMICLDYNLNKNNTFLETISDEIKPKVEFLINAICPPGCPNRKQHYFLNGIEHINFGKNYHINCFIDGNTLTASTCNYINNLTPEDVIEYSEKGFSNFKLEGRTLSDLELALNYIRYMIKPKYIFEATQNLLLRNEANKEFLKQELGMDSVLR